MKNILVAIEDCRTTTVESPLIKQAIVLAHVFSCKIKILHVVPRSIQQPFNIDKKTLRDEVAHELHDEHKLLQHLTQCLRNKNIDATSLLVEGEIIKTILRESDRFNIDLIILGRHRHCLLYSALMNGTEESLLRKCSHPIMFVPTPE